MAMQQPIPPEQPQTVDVQQTAPTEAAVVPTDTVVTETPVDVVTTDTVPADVAPVDAAPVEPVDAQPTTDTVTQEQVDEAAIETVASALQEDEITAEDIMAAILTETLGVSDSAARSLFNLLLQDTVSEVANTAETMADTTPTEEATEADVNAAVEVQDQADKKDNE